MKNKLNNKGFTLAELIIAIAILAIAITPLIANFIESGKMNKDSRVTLDATNMAQDIMEGTSSYTAPEFIALFESEDTLVNKLLPPTVSYVSHGDYTTDGSGAVVNRYTATVGGFVSDNSIGTRNYSNNVIDGKTSYKDVKKVDDYHFFIDGVRQGNNLYNLDFTLTTKQNSLNKKQVAKVTNIDKALDVTYSIDQNEYEMALDQFRINSSRGSLVDQSEFAGNLQHNVTINILNAGNETNPDYIVQVFSDYTVDDAALTSLGIPNDPAKKTVRPRTGSSISTLDSTKLPRGLYIYYQGLEGSSTSSRRDHFVINNTTGKALTVYLIRNQSVINTTYNNNYGTDVKIYSSDSTLINENTFTNIVSNQRFDLSYDLDKNIRKFSEDGTSDRLPGLKDEEFNNSHYNAERCIYKYNNRPVSEALYKTNFSDGYQKEDKNFIYQVKLDVRKVTGGSNEKVAEFSGSLSD